MQVCCHEHHSHNLSEAARDPEWAWNVTKLAKKIGEDFRQRTKDLSDTTWVPDMSNAMKTTWSTLTSCDLQGCDTEDLYEYTNNLNKADGSLRFKMIENPGDLPSVLEDFSRIVQDSESFAPGVKLTGQIPLCKRKTPRQEH